MHGKQNKNFKIGIRISGELEYMTQKKINYLFAIENSLEFTRISNVSTFLDMACKNLFKEVMKIRTTNTDFLCMYVHKYIRIYTYD